MPLAVVAPVVGTAAPPVAPAPIASAAAAAAAALAAARRPLAPMDTNSAASLARIVVAVQDVEKSTTKRKADASLTFLLRANVFYPCPVHKSSPTCDTNNFCSKKHAMHEYDLLRV